MEEEARRDRQSVVDAIAVPRVSTHTTSPAELVGAVERHGCVIVESLVSPEALDALRQELRGLLAEAPVGVNEFTGYATKLIYDPFARTRVLDDLVLHPLLRGALQALIGPPQLGHPPSPQLRAIRSPKIIRWKEKPHVRGKFAGPA